MKKLTMSLLTMGLCVSVSLTGGLMLAGCDSKPRPGPTWEPGLERFNGTVREKNIVLKDAKRPEDGVKCYQLVIETGSAQTREYCVTGEQWSKTKVGAIWIWEG